MILKGLTILFIGLKLTGHITWAWPLVLIPLFIIVARDIATQVIISAIKRKEPWAIRFAWWLKT